MTGGPAAGFRPHRPAFAVLCALVALSALFSGSIYPTAAVVFNAGAVGCLFLALFGNSVPALAAAWPGWLFAAVLYLSCLWTVSLNASLTQAFSLTFAVVFSCVAAFSAAGKRRDTVLALVVWVSAAVSLYGIYQYAAGLERTADYVRAYGGSELGLSDRRAASALAVLEYRRAFSTMLSPNVLACYLAMVFPAGVQLIAGAGSRASRAAYLSALALALWALLLTKSVGGLAALITGMVVLGIARYATGRVVSRRALAVFAAAAFLAAAAGYGVLSERSGGFRGVERSYSERLSYLRGALGSFEDAPIAGHGAGSFYLSYFSRMSPGAGESRFAHNVALQTLSETGLIGFTALALVFAVFAARCVRGIRREPDEAAYPALLAGGAAFLAHNMVDFTFYVHETAVLFWLYFGLASAGQGAASPEVRDRGGMAVKAVSAALAAALCFWYGMASLAYSRHSDAVTVLEDAGMGSAGKARSGPVPQSALELAEETVSLKSYDDAYWAFLATLREGAAYYGGPEYAKKAEQAYKNAISLNPLYPYHYRDLGILYMKLGRMADARACFGEAVRLYPQGRDSARLLSLTEK